MNNRDELSYLVRYGPVSTDRLTGGGANPGDSLVWDGSEWVPTPPPPPPDTGGNVRGLDVTLNFTTDATDKVAIVTHGLGTSALNIQLLTTAFEGLWENFFCPWRVLDSNRVEVRASLGFNGPARAIIQALVP